MFRAIALLLLGVAIALPSHADVFSYEEVGIAGRNNTVDSNAASCDSADGCYTRTGAECADDPNQLCDLQIVPAGRCTYGNLALGPASCVWPHRAGHCSGNVKVGCLTDDQCADAGGTCSLTTDIFGVSYAPTACTCQGTNPAGGDFEGTICGGTLAVCSDGDPMRPVGGLGTTIGIELKLGGPNSQTFADLGPAVTGSVKPDSTPLFAIENPPTSFDPQRDAGTIGRAAGGPIHPVRTTYAREILPYAHPTIGTPVDVRKVETFGDSYWSDWTFTSVAQNLTFNTHTVTYNCDVSVGWVVGSPLPGGAHCHHSGRNGLSFLWNSDLTSGQVSDYTSGGQRICPPNCNKDFNLTTTELQEFAEASALDPNAATQLALQSGEEATGRQAGARDAIGVSRIDWVQFMVDGDLRCRMGGWGNAPGLVGRCLDGPKACTPGTAGDALCAASPRQDGLTMGPPNGGSCRACGGVYDSIANPFGFPVGYNTHGRPELDLLAGHRIGGISGAGADVKLPLFFVETTGNVTAQFRDIASEGAPDVDLADMGPVDPTSAFASGIGAGGTFASGVDLNIDEPCCGTSGSVNVAWDPAQLGVVAPGEAGRFRYRYGPGANDIHISDWALTYDKGPGPDGIPGCIGDNVTNDNGVAACNNRLGTGPLDTTTDRAFATGKDDRAILYTVGSVAIPASSPRFQWGNSPASVVSYFGATENPPIVNTVAAISVRDLAYFNPRTADILLKSNVTACPLTSAGPQCTISDDPCATLGGDSDGDTICDDNDNCDQVVNPGQTNSDNDSLGDDCDNCKVVTNEDQEDADQDAFGNVCDNCPGTPNPNQADGQGGLESPLDGVGDACDNCPTVANGPAQVAVAGVGNQTNGTVAWVAGQALESASPGGVDPVGDACDNCLTRNNPRVAASFLTTTGTWATLSGEQRDDDHDGYGNQCDGKFPNAGTNHSLGDAGQLSASLGENRTGDTCGTTNTRPCAIFDLDVTNTNIGLGDTLRFYQMLGFPRGPRCPACGPWGSAASATTTGPLPCSSGTAGTCGPVP